jgi:hypothetical protein
VSRRWDSNLKWILECYFARWIKIVILNTKRDCVSSSSSSSSALQYWVRLGLLGIASSTVATSDCNIVRSVHLKYLRLNMNSICLGSWIVMCNIKTLKLRYILRRIYIYIYTHTYETAAMWTCCFVLLTTGQHEIYHLGSRSVSYASKNKKELD